MDLKEKKTDKPNLVVCQQECIVAVNRVHILQHVR